MLRIFGLIAELGAWMLAFMAAPIIFMLVIGMVFLGFVGIALLFEDDVNTEYPPGSPSIFDFADDGCPYELVEQRNMIDGPAARAGEQRNMTDAVGVQVLSVHILPNQERVILNYANEGNHGIVYDLNGTPLHSFSGCSSCADPAAVVVASHSGGHLAMQQLDYYSPWGPWKIANSTNVVNTDFQWEHPTTISLGITNLHPVVISDEHVMAWMGSNATIFDVSTGEKVTELDTTWGYGQSTPYGRGGSAVSGADFSPDGSLLAVGLGNSEIRIFNTSTWQVVQTEYLPQINGYTGWDYGEKGDSKGISDTDYLRFSPDGEYLAAGNYLAIEVIEVGTGVRIAKYDTAEHLEDLDFSPNGDILHVVASSPSDGFESLILYPHSNPEVIEKCDFGGGLPRYYDRAFVDDNRIIVVDKEIREYERL